MSVMVVDCGVAEHDDDCLCDVIITQPVSTLKGLQDNWALMAVAKYFDMSVPFSAEDFGFLLEKTDQFLEAYFVKKGAMDLGGFVPYSTEENLLNYYERMREYFVFLAEAHKGDILPSEAAEYMGLSHEEFVIGMTQNSTIDPARMNVPNLDFMVTEMRKGVTYNYLHKNHGLPRMSHSHSGLVWLVRQHLVRNYLTHKETT